MAEEKKDQEEKNDPAMTPDQEYQLQDYKSFFEDQYFADEIDFEIKLYRVTRPRTTEAHFFLKRYHNEIPDEEAIGREFGGGKYNLWSQHPVTRKIYTRRINLDPIFDQMKTAREKEQETISRANGKANPDQQLEYTANFVKDVIKPLIGETSQVNQGEKMVSNLMEGMVNMFTSSLKKMQMAVVENTIRDMKPKKEPEPEKPGMGEIVNGVLSIIDKFGDVFRNAKGAQLQAMQDLAAADPLYQQVSEDPDAIDAVYTAACQKFGKAETDDMFTKLGFELGEEQEPADQGSPEDPAAVPAGTAATETDNK